jgi:hypothetical protein
MADLKDLIEQLQGLSESEVQQVLEAIKAPAPTEVPFEIVKASDLEAGVEEKSRVIVFDKKMKRKLRPGEEGKQDEIASAEGTLEVESISVPGGSTTISGPTLTSGELIKAIGRDFGSVCKGGAVFLSDGFYFLYPDKDVVKVLGEDLTDLQMWINTYFDCDDFAQVVAGILNQQLKGIPFGTLWFKGSGIYHAVNCYYSKDQRKMKVVEPQTDGIYNFDKSKYCPMLVVI